MTNTADFLDELAKKDPRAAERLRKAEEKARKAGAQEAGPEPEGQPSLDGFEPIDFAALEGREPPPREWTIDGWIPTGTVTSLYGAGGIGKSMIAQQIGTCKALGVSAFGFNVGRPAPVVGFHTEDDNDELWRRQHRISGAIDARMGQLGKLHLQGRAGILPRRTAASTAARRSGTTRYGPGCCSTVTRKAASGSGG